jgi:hypothetical protein
LTHTELAKHHSLCAAECLKPLRAPWQERSWRRLARRVTPLGFLPRCDLPILIGNWFRELFAELKLLPGVFELVIDHPYSLDQTTDACSRSLYCAWRNCQSGLAQLAKDMGRIEAADAVVLEYPCDGLLTHTGSLLRRWHGLKQVEEPARTDVVGKLQHLWIIAPELMFLAVGETDVLNLQLFVNTRPFPELDDDGVGDGRTACVVSLRSTPRAHAALPSYGPRENRTALKLPSSRRGGIKAQGAP